MGRNIPASEFMNKKFGHLMPIQDLGRDQNDKQHKRQALCVCDCGNVVKKYVSHLLDGRIKSCSKHCPANNSCIGRVKHGMAKSREHRIWCNMKTRCSNPNSDYYERYGGRGIKVCPEWENSFEQFLKDMGPAPSNKHSIDRIDVNGDYTKDNCRWATNEEQSQNNSRNVFTPEKVRKARDLYKNGKGPKEISEILECSISTVTKVIHYITWKNIE